MFNKIKLWYSLGFWTEKMVQNAVLKNVLTQEQVNKILGKEKEDKNDLL